MNDFFYGASYQAFLITITTLAVIGWILPRFIRRRMLRSIAWLPLVWVVSLILLSILSGIASLVLHILNSTNVISNVLEDFPGAISYFYETGVELSVLSLMTTTLSCVWIIAHWALWGIKLHDGRMP